MHNFRGPVHSPWYLVCEDVEEYSLLLLQTADQVKDKIIQDNIRHCMKCVTELTSVIYCIYSMKVNNLSICNNFNNFRILDHSEWLLIIFSTSNCCFHRLLSVSMPSVEAAFRNGYVGNPHAQLTDKLLLLHS